MLKIVESVGAESLELARYRAKMEDRAQQEEELFMRAPITKKEKQKEKHLKKSRNGINRSFHNIGIEDLLDHRGNLNKHSWHQRLFILGICHSTQQKSKLLER